MNKKNKNIALFGGSFNPPHIGHFEMAKYIYETLEVDEVWFLFSQNWQKEKTDYAPLNHRMQMGRILAKQYEDMPFVMSGIQSEIGTHITYDVLRALKQREPESKFIWTMGADNLETFHTWHHNAKIIEEFPIAIVDRPSYTKAAKQSSTAIEYAHLQITNPEDLLKSKNGWCLLQNPQIDMSSSNILNTLNSTNAIHSEKMQEVTNYIKQHNLYQD